MTTRRHGYPDAAAGTPTRGVAFLLAGLLALTVLAGCSDRGAAEVSSTYSVVTTSGVAARFPDVQHVTITPAVDGTYTLDVTMTSPYDSPERYADGWRVLAPDGTVLGEHTLTHDHAAEQPFTRTQTGVEIPAGVTTIVVEGHDTANGYGGRTVEVQVP